MKTLNLGTPIANLDLPDATVLMDKLQRVADLINITKLDIDNINAPSPALVPVSNGSGIPAWQTVSGDLTVSPTSVWTIAAGAVTGGKIAATTITPDKMATQYIDAGQTGGVYIPPADGSFHVVPGAETAASSLAAGLWLAIGYANFSYVAAAGTYGRVTFGINHVAQDTQVLGVSGEHGDDTVTVSRILNVPASGDAQLMVAVTTGSGMALNLGPAATRLIMLRIT